LSILEQEIYCARKTVNDFSGQKIGRVIDGATFVPSAIVVQIAMNDFDEKRKKKDFQGLIIDGMTRILPEAEMLDEGLEWFEWDKDVYVLSIDISETEATSRLLNRRACADCKKIIPYVGEFKELKTCDVCGGKLVIRADDSPEGVKGRMAEYEKYVVPVIEYYEKAERLIRINGEQSIEDVHKDIIEAIGL
jgi:adenylate kinase